MTTSFQDDFNRELTRQIIEAAQELCADLIKLGFGESSDKALPGSFDELARLLPPKTGGE